jgi:hypothetical protein
MYHYDLLISTLSRDHRSRMEAYAARPIQYADNGPFGPPPSDRTKGIGRLRARRRTRARRLSM